MEWKNKFSYLVMCQWTSVAQGILLSIATWYTYQMVAGFICSEVIVIPQFESMPQIIYEIMQHGRSVKQLGHVVSVV